MLPPAPPAANDDTRMPELLEVGAVLSGLLSSLTVSVVVSGAARTGESLVGLTVTVATVPVIVPPLSTALIVTLRAVVVLVAVPSPGVLLES